MVEPQRWRDARDAGTQEKVERDAGVEQENLLGCGMRGRGWEMAGL